MKPNSPAPRKCPVCNYDLDAGAIVVRVGGKTARVCCEDCKRKLETRPEKYPAATRS